MARGPQPYIQSIVWKFVDRGLGKAKRLLGDYKDNAEGATEATRSMNVQAAQNTAAMKTMAEAEDEAADEAEDLADSGGKASRTIDRMKNSSNGAVRAMGNLAGKIRAAATSAKLWVAGGIAASIVAFSAAVAGATYKAASFENQLNEARKTAGLTEREFQDLTEGLLEVQAELGTSQQDLAAIAAEAGRLGIEGADNIKEFTRTVSLMSEATDVTADQAAQGLAKITNAFGMPITQAKALGSVLNELSNQTVASTGDLIDAMTRVGASASQVGLAADEVAGFAATLIDAGVSARRAGTGLRTIFTRMVNETEALGDQMGRTEDEVVQMFEEDGVAAIKTYLSALEDMDKQTRASAISDVFGVEQAQKVQALVSNMDNLTKQIEDAGTELKEADSLTAEFAATTKDVANEWNRLTAKLSAWVTDWGTNFTGYLESALAYLNDMAGGDQELMRDLTVALERAEETKALLLKSQRLRDLQKEGEEATKIMEELASRFPEFAEIGSEGDVLDLNIDRLQQRLQGLMSRDFQALAARRRQALSSVEEAYNSLAVAQRDLKKQQMRQSRGLNVPIEELTEARSQANRAEERLDTLAKGLVGQFADGLDVSREKLEHFLDQMDATTYKFESTEKMASNLIDRYLTLAEAKEKAGEADPTGGGDGGGGDELTTAPTEMDLGKVLEKARSMNEEAQTFLDTFGSSRIKAVLQGFNDELARLNLKLKRGQITQEQFARRAASAAQRYRGELRRVLEFLERMGLLTEDEVQAAVKAFDTLNKHAGESIENIENIGEVLQDVAGLVQGITDVADAFGDLDENTKEALGGVTQLVEKTGRLIELRNNSDGGTLGSLFSTASGAISGISSIVGAVGGLAQLISSATDDSARQKRIRKLNEQIGEQTAALRKNTEALYEQARIGSDISQAEIQRAEQILSGLPDEAGNGLVREQQINQLENTAPIFEGFGDLVEPLVGRVSSELGDWKDIYDISDADIRRRVLRGLTGEAPMDEVFNDFPTGDFDFIDDDFLTDVLGDDFQDFSTRLERLRGQFGEFGDSVEGIVAEIRLRKDELGQSFTDLRSTLSSRVDDLFDQESIFYRELSDKIEGASQSELGGLVDNLRSVIVGDKALDEVFTGNFFDGATLEQVLGDVSPSQFSDLLDTIDGLSEMEEGAGGGSGRDVRTTTQVSRTINEFQANQLLTFQQEQVFSLRRIEAVLRSGLSVPDSVGQVGAGDASTVYNVNIDTIEGDASTESVARQLEQELQESNLAG